MTNRRNLDLIRPLNLAENHFLQVLLTQFSLRRHGEGLGLYVRFNEETDAIWLGRAKSHIRDRLNKKSIEKYLNVLDAVLFARTRDSYDHDDPEFPFRFASGGTLPIIRMNGRNADEEDREYYCLFFRDIHPVGWNIANGGCDSRDELLNPLGTVERELREELIIVEPERKRRHVFEADEGKPADHPDFAIARRIWAEKFRKLNFPDLEEWRTPLKWLDGPDSLDVRFDREAGVAPIRARLKGCFLNINAEDFGIEIDRVAKINVDSSAILCDGELIRGRLLNGIIGLFDVQKLNAAIADGRPEVEPDHVFFDAKRWDPKELDRVVKMYLDQLSDVRTEEERRQFDAADFEYGLCPVTKSIIRRYLAYEDDLPPQKVQERQAADSCEIFISCGSEDFELARKVRHCVHKCGKTNVFFSDETLRHPNFGQVIDTALDNAACLVAVGTKPEHLGKPYVYYECSSYHQDRLIGRKPQARLFSVISGFSPSDLPRPMRYYDSIDYGSTKPGKLMRKLASLLP